MNSEWLAQLMESGMKRSRMAFKKRENEGRDRPSSSDLARTTDFTFARMNREAGDSGDLLLAKRKDNKKNKYIVKHAFSDCACNEFVYTKIVQAMGYHMPNAVLIELSSDERKKYFKTEYIIGEEFLNLVNPSPSFAEIREKAHNWQEYFSFCALSAMTQERMDWRCHWQMMDMCTVLIRQRHFQLAYMILII